MKPGSPESDFGSTAWKSLEKYSCFLYNRQLLPGPEYCGKKRYSRWEFVFCVCTEDDIVSPATDLDSLELVLRRAVTDKQLIRCRSTSNSTHAVENQPSFHDSQPKTY